jgi:hypothetical protein
MDHHRVVALFACLVILVVWMRNVNQTVDRNQEGEKAARAYTKWIREQFKPTTTSLILKPHLNFTKEWKFTCLSCPSSL